MSSSCWCCPDHLSLPFLITRLAIRTILWAVYFCSAMLWCLCPSVTFVSKWINISSGFSSSGSHTILVLPYQTLWHYSDGDPLTGEKIAIFDYLALESITAGPPRVVNISTVEYRLEHLCVIHLPWSTNAAAPCISGSFLWQKVSRLYWRQQNRI